MNCAHSVGILQELLHYYDKKTGRKSKKPPQFAKKGDDKLLSHTSASHSHIDIMSGQKVVAVIEASDAVCVERFSEHPQMGRFTLRDEGAAPVVYFQDYFLTIMAS